MKMSRQLGHSMLYNSANPTVSIAMFLSMKSQEIVIQCLLEFRRFLGAHFCLYCKRKTTSYIHRNLLDSCKKRTFAEQQECRTVSVAANNTHTLTHSYRKNH